MWHGPPDPPPPQPDDPIKIGGFYPSICMIFLAVIVAIVILTIRWQ